MFVLSSTIPPEDPQEKLKKTYVRNTTKSTEQKDELFLDVFGWLQV